VYPDGTAETCLLRHGVSSEGDWPEAMAERHAAGQATVWLHDGDDGHLVAVLSPLAHQN
jgi:hypothetical protein